MKKSELKKSKPKSKSKINSFFIKEKAPVDYTFLTTLIVIVCVGMVMLLSASAPAASTKFNNSYYFFIRQLVYVIAGAVLIIPISRLDYSKLKKYSGKFMLICVILLALVFLPGIGVSLNGSRRWINLGITNFQPSELTKMAVAVFFAERLETGKYDLSKIKGLTPFFFWIGVIAVLMLLETHLSGTIIICGMAVVILIVAGMKMKYLAAPGIAGGLALGAILIFNENRRARILSFLHPFSDTQGTGYQVIQGLYAISSGGLFGLGLGQSVQKYSYLPEPYNDFIFAIVCEELGFVGALLILGLFTLLILRGIKIALNAPDLFSMLTVIGIMAQLSIQVVLNILVVTSTIPNTGVTMPFFSYGGTAILVLLLEMGIVLGVSRQSGKSI